MLRARDWLARLAFTFFIIAALFLWQAHQARAVKPTPRAWIILYLLGAAISVALGIAGIRARHRPPESDGSDRDA